ncbi:MAG: NADH-quinone oxidoreductase subunit A [Pseudomonadota bacterium]
MDDLPNAYLPILVFLALGIVFSASLLLSIARSSVRIPLADEAGAKNSDVQGPDGTGHSFDVKFYLVAVLSMFFVMIIAFLFPWALALKDISMAAFWSMMSFLAMLGAGFAYAWKKGALEWQ